MPSDHDNRLALGQFIDRCERLRLSWYLSHDPTLHTPEYRYELACTTPRPAASTEGAPQTHAATMAIDAMDELRIGWEATDAQ